MSEFDTEILKKLSVGGVMSEAIKHAISYLIIKQDFDKVVRNAYVWDEGAFRPRRGKEVDDLVSDLFKGELE